MRTDEVINDCADPLWLLVCHPRVSLHGIAITQMNNSMADWLPAGSQTVPPFFLRRWLIPQAYSVALCILQEAIRRQTGQRINLNT